VPALGKVESIIHGRPDPVMEDATGFRNRFDFYEMFSGSGSGSKPIQVSNGSHPFFITETAATIHLAVSSPKGPVRPERGDPDSRAQIKRTWWRQMLNVTFLERHPKIKGVAFFEFIKFEEDSWRDFTTLGKGTTKTSVFGDDGGDKDGPTLAAFQDDLKNGMASLIRWGNKTVSDLDNSSTKLFNSLFSACIISCIFVLINI
jgi:hypothetical protein